MSYRLLHYWWFATAEKNQRNARYTTKLSGTILQLGIMGKYLDELLYLPLLKCHWGLMSVQLLNKTESPPQYLFLPQVNNASCMCVPVLLSQTPRRSLLIPLYHPFLRRNSSILDLRRLANGLYHFLDHLSPNLLSTLSHTNRHITQEWRMPHIACITISLNVRRPLEFRGIGVAGAYVAGLELLELLLCTEFVCL